MQTQLFNVVYSGVKTDLILRLQEQEYNMSRKEMTFPGHIGDYVRY